MFISGLVLWRTEGQSALIGLWICEPCCFCSAAAAVHAVRPPIGCCSVPLLSARMAAAVHPLSCTHSTSASPALCRRPARLHSGLLLHVGAAWICGFVGCLVLVQPGMSLFCPPCAHACSPLDLPIAMLPLHLSSPPNDLRVASPAGASPTWCGGGAAATAGRTSLTCPPCSSTENASWLGAAAALHSHCFGGSSSGSSSWAAA